MKLFILVISLFCFAITASGQGNRGSIELSVKNDNLGELSNLLKTGDDIGETHSVMFGATIQSKKGSHNYGIKLESAEYALFVDETPEPRDIYFTEVNNLELSVNNIKVKDSRWFYSISAGLYYVQGNKITPLATGIKYYTHEWVINKLFPGNYWIYVDSQGRDRFIPHGRFTYGHDMLLLDKPRTSLRMANTVEASIASNFNYTGAGARCYLDLTLRNDRFKMHAIDIEFECFYQTNLVDYQMAYCQLGVKLDFKRLELYSRINKPIKKNLDNPLLVHDDMELLFINGLILML